MRRWSSKIVMIRKTFLLTTFVLVFSITKAQDYVRPYSEIPPSGNTKFNICFSMGTATPIQDFASTNVKNSFWDFSSPDSVRLQGFAKQGFHFNISASYLFSDNLGIMVCFGGNVNSFDEGAFSSAIGYPTTNTSGNYFTGEYLIGPYLSFPVGCKFHIKINALIGLVANSYPVLDVALSDTTTYVRELTKGKGLGFNFGLGLEYSVNSTISILLNSNYTYADISYSSWTETLTYSIPGYYPLTLTRQHPTDATSMSTGIIKSTIGIEFKF